METVIFHLLRNVWQLFFIASVLSLTPSSVFSTSVSYTYDTHLRMTKVTYDNGAAVDFTYDAAGNQLTTSSVTATSVVYEDGEDGNIAGWDVYDSDPAGATIASVEDHDRGGKAIEFVGSGTGNGYRLRNADGSYWNDTSFTVLEWSMKYSEAFVVYVAVQTKDGFRYLYYTPTASDNLGTGNYVHHGLGAPAMDGTWQTFVRDLTYDLKDAQPDNELQAVLGFLIRGSGRVDDIRTRKDIPDGQDSDGDGITDIDEITIYGTNPYKADTDGDGITDNQELSYWGASWNADTDGDGIVNLLDPDADNDGIRDGVEIGQGTDPADAASVPVAIVYEDGEDGNIAGWDIYDNDPAGATITNIEDNDRGSKVIEFAGIGTSNGYRLRNADGNYWNDTNFKVLEWSMKYSEAFTVYVAVQTMDGFRYLYYTPSASDNLGTGTYVHHGLGTSAMDGTWQTFVRDLAYDLKDAQPDNELQAVLGFLIRGSGRVDDIRTRKDIPGGQDSDGDGITDTDEITIYGTNPYNADSDSDGINDNEELTYWGERWNADPDDDALINLLDPDADNDSFLDGLERSQGTDPADAASVPTAVVYEDAEDGNISGWDIYDHDPAGAVIANVYDDDRLGNVIEFAGSATNNGYRLRNAGGSYWNDTNFKTLEWSMKYSEAFAVYIATQTKDGFRYLHYTPVATDSLGAGTYVHHGLGDLTRDGNWHTLQRDLEADLKEAQPENELQAVLGFLIRGSGRVDDIRTRKADSVE
jgi:hypothetical protein